jgi:hypothetical protein
MLDQVFIRVYDGDRIYDKDIKDSTEVERKAWYDTLSKGQIAHVLEKIGGFNK